MLKGFGRRPGEGAWGSCQWRHTKNLAPICERMVVIRQTLFAELLNGYSPVVVKRSTTEILRLLGRWTDSIDRDFRLEPARLFSATTTGNRPRQPPSVLLLRRHRSVACTLRKQKTREARMSAPPGSSGPLLFRSSCSAYRTAPRGYVTNRRRLACSRRNVS